MPVAYLRTRWRACVVAGLAMLVCCAGLASPLESRAGSRFAFKSNEKCFMRRINGVRENHGLRRLRWDKQLGYVARRHARKMASDRAIYHDLGLARKVTRWRSLGQNTGRGGGCKILFRAFMNSSVHRSNILGAWRYVGVGVKKRNGKVYAQQIFESHEDPGNIYHYP